MCIHGNRVGKCPEKHYGVIVFTHKRQLGRILNEVEIPNYIKLHNNIIRYSKAEQKTLQ